MNKIITWNLRQGGGKRVNLILECLKEHSDATTIVLTEFRNNKNAVILEEYLRGLGFIHQYKPLAEPQLNSVLIVSKDICSAKYFPELGEYSQRVVKVYNNNYSIYGCYFPDKDTKKYLFEFLIGELSDHENEKIIITGDINTGKHYIDEKGATFFHSDYIDKFETLNLTDAWRSIHGDKRDFTWYSNAGNGFRLDHFFVYKGLKEKIQSCEYIHKYREQKISDHSMMIIEFENLDNYQNIKMN